LLLLIETTLIAWRQPAVLDDLRQAAFDGGQRLDPTAYDPKMPVRSLATIGHWPLPRWRFGTAGKGDPAELFILVSFPAFVPIASPHVAANWLGATHWLPDHDR
jgi:hypothetical protein